MGQALTPSFCVNKVPKPILLVLISIANSRFHLGNLKTGASINLCFHSSNIFGWAPPQMNKVFFLHGLGTFPTHALIIGLLFILPEIETSSTQIKC
ncbi:hypothetical protein DSO57_1017139 [Entomophthora muscae]|uniref:Uncharacterized protein n=1 Tax=Entomophthora muscae TaxID=34485 RepID=A0ACC2RJB5_9FUNG|nr:hypothetical protein DSO57_1017139 [Entomophthora muscae]